MNGTGETQQRIVLGLTGFPLEALIPGDSNSTSPYTAPQSRLNNHAIVQPAKSTRTSQRLAADELAMLDIELLNIFRLENVKTR